MWTRSRCCVVRTTISSDTTPRSSTYGRIAWCDDRPLTSQLPARYRACAACFRLVRRLQPRRITEEGMTSAQACAFAGVESPSVRLTTDQIALEGSRDLIAYPA